MLLLENVSKQYPPDVLAVDKVSLAVDSGEILTLIGPSGCGKTTLLRLINRLVEATEGKIFIDAQEITRWNPIELRRQIGYVIQQVGLFPHLDVGANISYVLRITGVNKREQRRRATELINLIGLDESYLSRYPAELSGGQAQRVGFARALAGDPSIILMDEPFGALDQITRLQLQDELLKIQQQLKKTVVLVTHDIQEAMKMGSRMGLMREGKLIQIGKPADFFNSPRGSFVADFIGSSDFFKLLGNITLEEIMKPPNKPANQNEPYLSPHMSLADALLNMLKNDVTEMVVQNNPNEPLGLVELASIKKVLVDFYANQTNNREIHHVDR